MPPRGKMWDADDLDDGYDDDYDEDWEEVAPPPKVGRCDDRVQGGPSPQAGRCDGCRDGLSELQQMHPIAVASMGWRGEACCWS